MQREPHKAQKTEPPSTQPAPKQGAAYDPMDRIVQDLQNIQSFLDHLSELPKDLGYVNTHLSQILALRRIIAHQVDLLVEEPYNYERSRLDLLKKENEQIFSYLEGAVEALNSQNPKELKRFITACEATLSKFDDHLTP